jgi:hypothetical protein
LFPILLRVLLDFLGMIFFLHGIWFFYRKSAIIA